MHIGTLDYHIKDLDTFSSLFPLESSNFKYSKLKHSNEYQYNHNSICIGFVHKISNFLPDMHLQNIT